MQLRAAAVFFAVGSLPMSLTGQQPVVGPEDGSVLAAHDQDFLTIYNQDFAVVRSTVPLVLKPGTTEVTTTKVTRQLEPDSVVLRDPKGVAIQVVEQNYDAAVIDQNLLLEKFEGQTIEFQNVLDQGQQMGQRIVTTAGKIVRAPDNNGRQPIVEVDGKLQFQLPGTPIFPAKADSLLLKPTLRWQIASPRAENLNAELDFITRGLSWQSTYNIVLPEQVGASAMSLADVVGWVTIHNESGTEFPKANIKLMAGDVAKIEANFAMVDKFRGRLAAEPASPPPVTQKAFDDFHLYDLHRTVDLRDGETKQVEFMRAARVPITRKYEYDGAQGVIGLGEGLYLERTFGISTSPRKVAIAQEFKNSEANHLGMPLPAGRLRFYRQDTGGQVEFTGESTIDHTPKDGLVRVVTGNAFDITGDRKQTDFHADTKGRTLDESFEIKVTNAKEQPVTVSVIEHLSRWSSWKITKKSGEFAKTDSRTIEFPVELGAGEEKTVSYTVHYSW